MLARAAARFKRKGLLTKNIGIAEHNSAQGRCEHKPGASLGNSAASGLDGREERLRCRYHAQVPHFNAIAQQAR
jgi:hypothetical protein